MKTIYKSAFVVFITLLFLSGCGTYLENPALTEYQPDNGYRFKNLITGEKNKKDQLFVIMSFSGGGTRAAALSYGVLEGLQKSQIIWQGKAQSLLDEVDVISSISGGSFTAAYYGLYRDKTFTEFADKFLYRPVQSDLLKQAYNPVNWFKLAGGSYGRSDLAFDYYNEAIFDHATFADLSKLKTRPFISINATDLTLGAPFSFTQEQFDLLCSDLDQVPVARAVASSSAFPGLLTPLTYKNHECNKNYPIPVWVKLALLDRESGVNPRRTNRAENIVSYLGKTNYPDSEEIIRWRPYIHLTDGGVADNIGLRDPLAAMTSVNHPWSIMRMINNGQIDKLVVIVVNAATNPDNDRDESDDVPGLVDTLVSASTIPLDNYSFDTLRLLEGAVSDYNEAAKLIDGCQAAAKRARPPCDLKLKRPHHVELYPVVVEFDRISDRKTRHKFKNLPTNFELSRETIDSLRDIAQRLLENDRQYKRLMNEIGKR